MYLDLDLDLGDRVISIVASHHARVLPKLNPAASMDELVGRVLTGFTSRVLYMGTCVRYEERGEEIDEWMGNASCE